MSHFQPKAYGSVGRMLVLLISCLTSCRLAGCTNSSESAGHQQDGARIVRIASERDLERSVGQRVEVTGTLIETKATIQVQGESWSVLLNGPVPVPFESVVTLQGDLSKEDVPAQYHASNSQNFGNHGPYTLYYISNYMMIAK